MNCKDFFIGLYELEFSYWKLNPLFTILIVIIQFIQKCIFVLSLLFSKDYFLTMKMFPWIRENIFNISWNGIIFKQLYFFWKEYFGESKKLIILYYFFNCKIRANLFFRVNYLDQIFENIAKKVKSIFMNEWKMPLKIFFNIHSIQDFFKKIIKEIMKIKFFLTTKWVYCNNSLTFVYNNLSLWTENNKQCNNLQNK